MAKEKHSKTTSDGMRWFACSECERGGNGSDKEKCSCGWQVKRFNGMGCFAGTEIKDKTV
jgi:hypothetical protein